MKKALKNFREFFWPLTDKPTPEEKKKLEDPTVVPEVIVDDENLESAYVLSESIYNDEEERRKGVESKAALLLSSISIASSIIVTASAYISGTDNITIGARISICVSAVIAIYATRAVWFSIRTLERGSYHQIGITEINMPGNKNQHLKGLIKEYWKISKINAPVVDKKVDFLVLAQEYYKRAIIVIFLYSVVVLATSLLPGSFLGKRHPSEPKTAVDSIAKTMQPPSSVIAPLQKLIIKPTDTLSIKK